MPFSTEWTISIEITFRISPTTSKSTCFTSLALVWIDTIKDGKVGIGPVPEHGGVQAFNTSLGLSGTTSRVNPEALINITCGYLVHDLKMTHR